MILKITVGLFILISVNECQATTNRRTNSGRDGDRHHDQGNRDLATRFSQAINDFGITLYKELAPYNPSLVLSPVSALTLMSMVMSGAVGETKQNLFQGLRLRPLGRTGIVGRAFKQYARSFAGPFANTTFSSANGIFFNPDRFVSQEFRRHITRFYDGENRHFDFSHPGGPEAPINEWIEMKTGGMVQDIVSEGEIAYFVVLWFLNAVSFNGTFESAPTSQDSFSISPSQERPVNSLHTNHLYAARHDPDLQVKTLELPYVGDRFSLFILLPDSTDLTDLETRLDYQTLEGLLTNDASPSRYEVFVPRFRLESTLNLIYPLRSMGVTSVFRSGTADLSGMSGLSGVYLYRVTHNAAIEVDENGTLVGALTSGSVRRYASPPQSTVDRPFMFVLRDKITDTNLFMGRVVSPVA